MTNEPRFDFADGAADAGRSHALVRPPVAGPRTGLQGFGETPARLKPGERVADGATAGTPLIAARHLPIAVPETSVGVDVELERRFEHDLLQHRRLFAQLEGLREGICEAAVLMADSLHHGGRLLCFGVGESAIDARQLVNRFNQRLRGRRRALPAVALNVKTAGLHEEDEGEDDPGVARLVASHARVGDCLIGLCSGAQTTGMVRTFDAARQLGVAGVALLNPRCTPMETDVAIVVGHDDIDRLREAQLFIGHVWADQIRSALGME